VAIRALGSIGLRENHPPEVEQAVPTLIASLEVPGLRSDAAVALGRIRDPRAVPALAAQLGDADQEFWKSVVWALGSIAAAPGGTGEAGVSALTAALKADDPRRREGAAAALRGVESPAAVGPLTAALRDPVAAVRAEAAAALGWKEARNTAAIAPLIATLARDPSWQVVDNAIEALGEIGPPAITPLIAAFGRRSQNEALPLYAERALLEIDAAHPKVDRVLRAELIAATRNQDANVVKWAAITLGDLGYSEEAAEALRRLHSSREEGLAWVAKEALREMGVEIE
jgi:HEAT repeat protein